MNKLLTHLGLIIGIGILQVSLLPHWPLPVRWVHLVAALTIFVIVVVSFEYGLLWAFTGGIFLELYSGYPFGVTLLALLLTAISVNALFAHFFTNRSLYSLLLLSIIGTLLFNLFLLLSSGLLHALGLTAAFHPFIFSETLRYVSWQVGLNALVVAIIFLVLRNFTTRLHVEIHRLERL